MAIRKKLWERCTTVQYYCTAIEQRNSMTCSNVLGLCVEHVEEHVLTTMSILTFLAGPLLSNLPSVLGLCQRVHPGQDSSFCWARE